MNETTKDEPFEKNLLCWDSTNKCWHPKKWQLFFKSQREQIKYLKKQYPKIEWTYNGC